VACGSVPSLPPSPVNDMGSLPRDDARFAAIPAVLSTQAALEYIELSSVLARATRLAHEAGDWALGNWPLIVLVVVVALVTVGRVGRR
jgi:hypothetical protein